MKKGPIPKATQEQIAARLLYHVEKHWPGRVRKILLRFRGAYAYIAVLEAPRGEKASPQICRHVEEGEVPLQLCRLGYLGSVNRWEYAFYKYSDERYEPSIVLSGSFVATAEEAFETSALVYLSVSSDALT